MPLKPARLQWSDDGTLKSLDYGDVYFQYQDGLAEKRYVFLERNRLPERFATAANFRIAELGFGSGLNFLATAQLWRERAPKNATLTYVSFEKHPISGADLKRIHAHWPEFTDVSAELAAQYPPMIEGFHALFFPTLRLRLILAFGDARDLLPELRGNFDAWYLDGFSPSLNADMWEENLLRGVAEHLAPGGTLATFSSVGDMRRVLKSAGLDVRKEDGFGSKWHMTVAQKPGAASTSQEKTVTVLGAGIAGAAAARSLAERGCRVTLIDRSGIATETSGNPVGIVYPKLTMAESSLGAFYQHGFSVTRARLRALKLPSWNPCGVLHLDLTEERAARHRALAAQYDAPAYAAYDGGLWQPGGGYLSPPEFCRALADHPHITMQAGAMIEDLNKIEADAIVIALGMDSSALVRDLPLRPVRGQVTALASTPTSASLDRVICHEGFITPAVGGLHYAGATFQKEALAAAAPRDADNLENLRALNDATPQFGFTASSIVGGRAGYRATTPDRLPLIGKAPDRDSQDAETRAAVYISTGFGSFGMTGAPLAGEMIAAMITGDPMPLPARLIEKLAPSRFILRDLKRSGL